MSDVAISVSNISKCYRVFDNQRSRLLHAVWPRHTKGMQEVWALKDINFAIKRGESVAIIGRNGGGKSTLLEILTRTLTPTTGSVKVNGRVSALLELGSGFNPEYSGRDNVILNGLLLGLSKDDILSRFGEIEAFAEIGAAIDRPVKTYSSGMMMRLAFAVQVLCDPDILIIDEALSVGDFFFQQKCFKYIRELTAKSVTLLFVSHDMGTVRDLCDRVIYLKSGKIELDGPTNDGISVFFREKLETNDCVKIDTKMTEDRSDLVTLDLLASTNRGDRLMRGKILTVSFLNKFGDPENSFRIGERVRISVEFSPETAVKNQITIGLTNKYGHLVTATGSSQLGIEIPNSASPQIYRFDLWLDLLLEAGTYSVTVTLGFDTGVNLGERLDQCADVGLINVKWDYANEVAPFIGQFGVPAQANVQLVT